MSNKSKVKSYVRKGKVVRSYDRNKKKVSLSMGVGALGGLATGLAGAALLKKKFPNINPDTIASIGANAALLGTLGGAVAGTSVGKRLFLSPEERARMEQSQRQIEKMYIPYQDKDLSGMAGAISGATNAAMLGGIGSLGYAGYKLSKQIKSKYPTVSVAKALTTRVDPAVLQRYGGRALKGAGKVALVAGVAGAGLGYLQGRNFANKINKRLGREDIKEDKKQRTIKIVKGVGAAVVGAGVAAGLGYGIGKLQTSNPAYQKGMKELSRELNVISARHNVRKIDQLEEAGVKLAEKYKKLSGQKRDVKLIGDYDKATYYNNLKLREQIRDQGFRTGKRIKARTIRNTEAINKFENYITNPSNNAKLNAALYAPTGAVLGVGIYKNSYGKNNYSKRDKRRNK